MDRIPPRLILVIIFFALKIESLRRKLVDEYFIGYAMPGRREEGGRGNRGAGTRERGCAQRPRKLLDPHGAACGGRAGGFISSSTPRLIDGAIHIRWWTESIKGVSAPTRILRADATANSVCPHPSGACTSAPPCSVTHSGTMGHPEDFSRGEAEEYVFLGRRGPCAGP